MQKTHPEYYALINGKRDTEHRGKGTACYSSKGLENETINFVRFLYDKYDIPSVDIWPGDGFKQCQCDGCKGKTPSELVWGFADRVATEVYKTHPKKLITCGAYTSYIEAPDNIEKFSPNLAVWIANSARPKMTDPEHWNEYWTRVQKWKSKMAPGNILRLENNRYHIWGVTESEDGKKVRGLPLAYPVIHPRATARDLKALKGISRGDTGEQSQFQGKWKVPGIEPITLYVQSRFLWNADLDVDEVLNEYCEKFYGPAAKQMKAAIDFAEANLAFKDQSRSRGRGDPRNVSLDTALKLRDLLDAAKASAGDTIYGRRVQMIINDLQPREDVMAKYQKDVSKLSDASENLPSAIGVEGSDLSKATEYFLKKAKTGEEPELKTSFKVGWENNALILEITCKEPKVKDLISATDIYGGEFVAITIQTQFHKHYILEINPDGLILEGDPKMGWKSLAEVKPERGEDFWRLTVRIPVVGANEAASDPNHRVAGEKPSSANPWFINIGRQVQKSKEREGEIQLFSPSTKKGWHNPAYFGKLEIK